MANNLTFVMFQALPYVTMLILLNFFMYAVVGMQVCVQNYRFWFYIACSFVLHTIDGDGVDGCDDDDDDGDGAGVMVMLMLMAM